MARRSEGSRPKRRKDGRWEARYIDATGKRRSVYGQTERDVKRKLRDRLEERDQGVGGEATTVGGWLTAWLSREKKRPTTMASRRYHIGLLPRWFLKIRLNDESLSPAHVARVLDELLATPTSRGEPRAPKTVADVRTTLVRAFGQAQRWGLLSRNPAALVDPPYVPETEILPLSIDEARSLLDAVAGHRLESLYTVAISHGIRMSEAIGAQWSYVDLAAGTFEVWPTLTRTMEGEVVEGGTKNRRRRRFVLTATAVEQLHVHKQRLDEECQMLGDVWTVNNLVWPSQVGTPLGHRALLRHLHGACARAGIGRVSFHTLRHSAATLLLAQGVDSRVVMEILGHTSPAMMRRYQHVVDELKHDAAAAMDAALRPQKGSETGSGGPDDDPPEDEIRPLR
jgi:integrase